MEREKPASMLASVRVTRESVCLECVWLRIFCVFQSYSIGNDVAFWYVTFLSSKPSSFLSFSVILSLSGGKEIYFHSPFFFPFFSVERVSSPSFERQEKYWHWSVCLRVLLLTGRDWKSKEIHSNNVETLSKNIFPTLFVHSIFHWWFISYFS